MFSSLHAAALVTIVPAAILASLAAVSAALHTTSVSLGATSQRAARSAALPRAAQLWRFAAERLALTAGPTQRDAISC